MKQFLLVCSVILLLAASLQAQDVVYDANAEIRTVEAFKGMEVSGGISLYFSQGKEQAVAVSAGDQKFVGKVKTEVRNGILKIYVASGAWNNWNWGNRKIKAYVTVTSLESLELGGASVAKLSGELQVNDLRLEVSGASVFSGIVKGKSIQLEVSGASVARLEGQVQQLNVEASGASVLKGFDLVADFCRAEASGASSIRITVNKELEAEASGASGINYHGTAVATRVDVSGASNIRKKD